MDKKLKAKWIKALKSGRYEQTKEQLKGDGGYCCLGVLLTVSRKGRWDEGVYRIGDGYDQIYCDGDLGNRGRELFGLPTTAEEKLVKMNDGAEGVEQQNFKQIAAWIRANVK